ncbi:hypothetical protein CHH55_23915 [Niallia circulans]|jgi:hypothetical protein|uniref:Uncharacterized protein n=1 Tax=Niallia circulans TaxID=1397 RepID=A0A0J1IPV7_NIACI|nr:hypothetical protein [Niallia circulans]KLV27989.1 hypothetical protein ABW02_03620 [Niallia circulans]MCM2980930.1 hypothetical protein [Niallia circulans]MDR4314807.1 hypothetical protein [Niallia circulans]MED3837878.1 hypothetical protein [Niallia circulans]MED4242975.1 hypothetical protein [Niallia circulans]
MANYTSSFSSSLVSNMISFLEDAKEGIQKNFEQMDLENASVEEEMREKIEEMIIELNRLIVAIESVPFR